MEHKKTVAIVLAAGSGKRMLSSIPKQYLQLDGKPILYYSLKTFEDSSVDEIILVVGKEDIDYCRKTIIEEYHFKKVSHIIVGGVERYHSVYQGLNAISFADYVLIHDGARPFVTVEMIERTIEQVVQHNACIVGVPTKDTIKLVDGHGTVIETPNRDKVWSIQTPQAFSFDIIIKAYRMIMDNLVENITDDAMVVEHTMNYPIKLVMGSYRNIKITTPEDIQIGETLLKRPVINGLKKLI
jgi:2-C-methyl-D-erythritol 4-phosphate cytidylyltransferase